MAQATFYTHAKKHNSTSVPSGGSAHDVELKGGADLIDPVFTMQFSGTPQYSMMNYEGRYYFITGIRSIRQDLWEISGHVDVLATYASNIRGTSAFVLYHTHNNTELSDRRLGVKTTARVQSSSGAFDTFGAVTPSTCGVVVNVTGEDSCAAYSLTQADARDLLNEVDNWYENEAMPDPPPGQSIFASIEEALTWFCNCIFNAFKQLIATGKASDSIKSAFMLPFTASSMGDVSEPIQLGKYKTTMTGSRITNRTRGDDATVAIPWQATDWRRNAPYHEIFLYLPFIGLVNISPSDVIGVTSLYVHVEVDLLSGDTIFTVSDSANHNHVIAQYNTNLAASYAIGASNINPASAATAIISGAATVAGAVTTGGLSLALGTAGVIGLANNMQAQPTCIGSNAGGAAVGLSNSASIVCYTVFHDTIEAPSNMSNAVGTPTNCVKSIGSISGYVQTRAASVSGSMTDTEREEINSLLDGGVFIE